MRATVAADIRSIFNSQDLAHAEASLAELALPQQNKIPNTQNQQQTAA
jgi:hypothetical protein